MSLITGKMGTHRKWHPLTICVAVLICIVSSKSSNSVTFPSPVLVVQLCSSQRCPCRKQDQEASADCADGDFNFKFDTSTTGYHCFTAQLMTHQLFGNRPVRASAPRTLTMATHKIHKNWTWCHCCLLNGQDAHVTAMSKLVLQSQDYIQARISCSVCITDFISSTHTWMLQNSWDHPCAITIRGWHQLRAHASTLECLMEWDSNGF